MSTMRLDMLALAETRNQYCFSNKSDTAIVAFYPY
jgi:hypothetical protein